MSICQDSICSYLDENCHKMAAKKNININYIGINK